jgi:signal transduction histidine kinase
VRYRPDIETAVYFCCLEALQNAAKHAPDASATVTLRQEESTLTFDVADDGPGFDPVTNIPGRGFQNMTDRLGAIGGLLSWTSAPGQGTRVRGEVPLAVLTPQASPGGTP